MKTSAIMIQLTLWAMLSVESLALDKSDYYSILRMLIESAGLDYCGQCAICSACFETCPKNGTGLESTNSITQICNETTDSLGFWSCVCTTSLDLMSNFTASEMACVNGIGNEDANTVLAAFSTSICPVIPIPPMSSSSASATSSHFKSFILSSTPTAQATVRSSGTPKPTTDVNSASIKLSTSISPTASAIPTKSSLSSSGLSSGAKAGIAVGSVVGGITLLGALFFFAGLRRKTPEELEHERYGPASFPPQEQPKAETARYEEFNPYPGPHE